jgi:hypothetical protein
MGLSILVLADGDIWRIGRSRLFLAAAAATAQ